MDQNPDSTNPAPSSAPEPETPKAEDTTPAQDVSVSLNDPVTPSTPAVIHENPGHGLGVASLIVSILGIGLVGIILGIIGLNKSKKAGQKNGLAIAGIIVGVLNVIVVTTVLIVASLGVAHLATKCAELGSGVHVVNGVTYTCNV